MIKDMIADLKIAAMEVVNDVKDVAHDVTTKLPNAVQDEFNKENMNNNINANPSDLMYLNNAWQVPNQMTANRIDMVADKINFVSSMIQQGLLAFDGLEEELKLMANSPTPPSPAQLVSIASRIDTNQKQIFMGLQKLRELSVEIDKATDTLQGRPQNISSGWGKNSVGSNQGWY